MSKDIIEYLEKLVLISFTEDEKKRISREIEKIVEMFNMLNSVKKLEQWEPLYHVHDISLSLRNDDEIGEINRDHSMLKYNIVLVDDYVKAPKTVSE